MHQRSAFVSSGRAFVFLGLTLGWLAVNAQLRAEIVVSTFEEQALTDQLDGNQVFRGQSGTPSTFRSGNVEFSNDGAYFDGTYTFWSGIGYSQRPAQANGQYWEQGNDLVAKPGVGDNSDTWGVIYGDSTLTAEAGYVFDSLAITNTLWTWDTMANQDPYIESNTPFTAGDFFIVQFTKTGTTDTLEVPLADFRGAQPYILTDWTDISLAGLNASELSVSFIGSRNNQWGLITPAYAAIDNVAVSAVPEPSSLALLGAGGSLGVWFRWRKRKQLGK